MPDYVGQTLAGKPETIVKFITDNIADLAKDNRKVRVLFKDKDMHADIKDYPDESINYVLVNVLYRLVRSNKLSGKLVNQLWSNAMRAVTLKKDLIIELSEK